MARGRKNKPHVITTLAQRRAILQLRREGVPTYRITQRYGVCEDTVRRIDRDGETGLLRFAKWLEARGHQAGQDDPPAPDEPTDAVPGSAKKRVILAQRAKQGRALFHPDDLAGTGDYYDREGFRDCPP